MIVPVSKPSVTEQLEFGGGGKGPHIYLEFEFSSIYCLSPLFYRHFQELLPQEKIFFLWVEN